MGTDPVEPADRVSETRLRELADEAAEMWGGGLVIDGICSLEVTEYRSIVTELLASRRSSGAMMDPAETFAAWMNEGPKLAAAAGLYVGIKVMDGSMDPSRKQGLFAENAKKSEGDAS